MTEKFENFFSSLDAFGKLSQNAQDDLQRSIDNFKSRPVMQPSSGGATKGSLIGLAVAGIAGIGFLVSKNKARQGHAANWQDRVRNSEATNSAEKAR